jgi:hypothetical protein
VRAHGSDADEELLPDLDIRQTLGQ